MKTHFDTSNYPEDHPSGVLTGVNKKVVGMFKHEFGSAPLTGFQGLRAKCYAIRSENLCEKRAKCVWKRVVDSCINFEHYHKCLT